DTASSRSSAIAWAPLVAAFANRSGRLPGTKSRLRTRAMDFIAARLLENHVGRTREGAEPLEALHCDLVFFPGHAAASVLDHHDFVIAVVAFAHHGLDDGVGRYPRTVDPCDAARAQDRVQAGAVERADAVLD